MTELLFATGGGDSVVGVIDTSDWPAAAPVRALRQLVRSASEALSR
jgi:hypothetical protein